MTRGSVIIPAYNESASIGGLLDSLYAGGLMTDVDVVVACNGCTDDTVATARSRGYDALVLDLPEPGKSRAIRAAEQMVTALPRVYLDADCDVSAESLLAVLDAVSGPAIAARAPVRFDLAGCDWVCRSFYRTKARLDGVATDLCGGGMYALSAEARGRFDEFPDVAGDDLFAARVVRPDEITIVDTAPTVVRPPRTTRSLIRVRTRVARGNQELAESRPDLARFTTGSTMRDLLRLLPRVSTGPDAAVYVVVVLLARVRVRFARTPVRWERDESSR